MPIIRLIGPRAESCVEILTTSVQVAKKGIGNKKEGQWPNHGAGLGEFHVLRKCVNLVEASGWIHRAFAQMRCDNGADMIDSV